MKKDKSKPKELSGAELHQILSKDPTTKDKMPERPPEAVKPEDTPGTQPEEESRE